MTGFKRAAFTLLITAIASTAHAGGAGSFLFRCGFKAGGTEKVQQLRFESRSKKKKSYAPDFTPPKAVGLDTSVAARPSAISVGRYREPPTLTITSFRCTW